MDLLSDVLRVVRLSGVMHFCADFTEPWAFRSSTPELLAARLKRPAGSVTPFHVFVEGDCWVETADIQPIRLTAGDVVVFPRADQHVMASDLSVSPVPIKDIYREPTDHRVAQLSYGGGGTVSRFLCGFLHSDRQFDPLLRALPAAICIRSGASSLTFQDWNGRHCTKNVIGDAHEVEWWQTSLAYLVNETLHPKPGNHAVLARLAESLFIGVLRWQLRFAERSGHGWFGGLHDPQISVVLRLFHTQPERAWTVGDLAKEAGVSRSVLSQRFAEVVGQPPIEYLIDWRMHLARQLLSESRLSLGDVAARVGYASEASFSRAFKRKTGLRPGQWRRGDGSVFHQRKT